MKLKNYVTLLVFLVIGATAFSQGKQLELKGKVKDSNSGEALIGVVVQVAGSPRGVQTDVNGQFALKSTAKLPLTLIVSYAGYERQEFIIESVEDEFLFEIRQKSNLLNQVVVTSRRRAETAQSIPIAISVLGSGQVEDAGAFNVNRVKELVPSVQLYSSNPRNTALNIRGLGSTFGLTNDGIEQGVGFYVDGVYFARPAATTLDFIDIDQIEVLRGPQGTLFGKNTTAGAFNVTTRKASFTPGTSSELSYGDYGYIQAKASITGPLSKKIAGRLSFSGTQRDGFLENVKSQQTVNDLNNLGARGQLLYKPTENTSITLAADITRQRPNGYAQVVAGVVTTKRSSFRQFNNIIKDLGYSLPSQNPFDRKIDQDTPWRSNQDLGGVSLNVDTKLGSGTLTSTSAYRYWIWDPSNDRDFTGLSVLSRSEGTSRQDQISQEIRWAGSLSEKVTGVFGLFAFGQQVKSNPVQTEEAGDAQWRFSIDKLADSTLWKTPGLLKGYGIHTTSKLSTFSGAVFSQVDWAITSKLHVLPGLRLNYDKKSLDYDRKTYGGLQTTNAKLIALQKKVYSDQSFSTNTDDINLSGQFTLAYKASKNFNAFATFSTGFKSVGLNVGGIPTNADGTPTIELAKVKPEKVYHYELGIKSSPTANSTLNVTVYNTDINNFQTLVQSPDITLNRGYLANAEKVNAKGVEVDGDVKVNKFISFFGSVSYTDGKYVSFTNAPLPLEETGLKAADNVTSIYSKDISGSELPGISKWAGTLGTELVRSGRLLGRSGKFFLALDSYARSSFSSSPTPSAFLNIDGYALLNGRVGFRASDGVSIFVWGRNILNKNYFEQLLVAGGNAGQYAGVLGDPRTLGVTLRRSF
ncbi:MAG: TonB-dependent receptor [Bacteroidales bacterium]